MQCDLYRYTDVHFASVPVHFASVPVHFASVPLYTVHVHVRLSKFCRFLQVVVPTKCLLKNLESSKPSGQCEDS